jgi:MFS family permease
MIACEGKTSSVTASGYGSFAELWISVRLLPKAIAATLGVQAIIVLASLVVPLTATAVAPRLGVEPHLVGYYAALTFLAAAFASLVTPRWVRRFGAIRVHQIMLLVAVVGLLMLRSETLVGFALSALLLGLAYGPANPASSSLLARYAAPASRARVFALKQTAVPLGAALAGFAVPFLMTKFGWPATVLAVVAICLLAALLVGGWRGELDDAQGDLAPVGKTGAVASLRLILGNAGLQPLGIMAVCFAATQFNFTAVFAAVLVERMRWSPVEAGATLSIAMAVSVGSRLGWGWVADHAPPRLVLAGLGTMMALATIACAFLSPAWPALLIYAVAFLFGASGSSWNGLALSEAAHFAPSGQVGEATAGVMFFIYGGALLGPALFSLVTSLSGTLTAPFLLLGVLALLPVPVLLRMNAGSASSGATAKGST